MSLVSVLMIAFWVVVLAVVVFFAVREIRAKRQSPPEFDRFSHDAVRQAGINQDGRGANGGSQTWAG